MGSVAITIILARQNILLDLAQLCSLLAPTGKGELTTSKHSSCWILATYPVSLAEGKYKQHTPPPPTPTVRKPAVRKDQTFLEGKQGGDKVQSGPQQTACHTR